MDDLKWIKKHFGEEMTHLCRRLFPKLLENEGQLSQILKDHFCPDRQLAKDIIEQKVENDFADYIFSQCETETKLEDDTSKTAVELLDEAGYILYPECKTEEDIQQFKKYFAPGEELCTFRGGRLDSCRVWFAVKKNVDDIKRENFDNPKRQDEYGTSVISIQFTWGPHSQLSIKNRYNHTVKNPDNTFNSNLDNIIFGLTSAFERDYAIRDKFSQKPDFELGNYVNCNNKFYKFNQEIDNTYYCPNNLVIDNFKPIQLPNHIMLVEYYVFDFKNKTIKTYVEWPRPDAFVECMTDIEKIDYSNNVITVTRKTGTTTIQINDDRKITGFKDNSITHMGKGFFEHCATLKSLEMSSLERCGDGFLRWNRDMISLSLPALKYCDGNFMHANKKLKFLSLPSLEQCGRDFLYNNEGIRELSLPNLKKCDDHFMSLNYALTELNLPQLKECGDYFLDYNECLTTINLPELEQCGAGFLYYNEKLSNVFLPKLRKCHNFFLSDNYELESLNLPNLQKCGTDFLYCNKKIANLSLPKLRQCGGSFLIENNALKTLSLPNLKSCGGAFLSKNKVINSLSLPLLEKCGEFFLSSRKTLEKLIAPNLTKFYPTCFYRCSSINEAQISKELADFLIDSRINIDKIEVQENDNSNTDDCDTQGTSRIVRRYM